MNEPQEDRVSLVTGASRGIGFAVAKELAKQGSHIIAIARTVGGLEELDDEIQKLGGSTTLVPLDLKDLEAIDRLGASIFERWGKLDNLILNAGNLGVISPLSHIEHDRWEDTFTLNVTVNWRLIRSLEPLLKLSDAPRSVVLTSKIADECPAYWGPYAITKAALNAMVKTWAAENKNTKLRINAVDPGPVRTALRAKAMPGEDPQTIPSPDKIAPAITKLCRRDLSETGRIFTLSEL